jgi:hypothetical protein
MTERRCSKAKDRIAFETKAMARRESPSSALTIVRSDFARQFWGIRDPAAGVGG